MAVRQHLAALSRQGLVGPEGRRPSRGRPAQAYGVTPAAATRLPDRSGALALEVLLEIESIAGRAAVLEALERRARRMAEVYGTAVQGRGPAESVRTLARLRDGEGYVCDAERDGGPLPDLVERHCPVAALAERWPEVCRLEQEVFRRVLGRSVERREHILNGDRCCRYTVGAEV